MDCDPSQDPSCIVPLYTAPIRELLYAAERYGSEFDGLPADIALNHLRETIVIARCQAESAVIALRVVGACKANEVPSVIDWLNKLRVDFDSIVVDAQRLLDLVARQARGVSHD